MSIGEYRGRSSSLILETVSMSIGDGPFYSFLLKAGDGVLDVPGDLQVCKL